MRRQLAFCGKEFGPFAARKAQARISERVNRLTYAPRIGARELLLEDQPEEYRYLVVPPHFKVIYIIDEENEEVSIEAFWDTRREPLALINRLR